MKEKRKAKILRLVAEQRGHAEDIALLERQVRTWKRRTISLGLLLLTSITLVVPFSEGHSLHGHFGGTAKVLVYTSLCLLSAFMYAVATVYNLQTCRRALRQIYDGK